MPREPGRLLARCSLTLRNVLHAHAARFLCSRTLVLVAGYVMLYLGCRARNNLAYLSCNDL